MEFKDTTDPGDENFDAPPSRRASAFGQSLPQTAPVPDPEDPRVKERQKAFFDVPDWRPEEEILLEAAAADPRIAVPEHLRRDKPKRLESPQSPPVSNASGENRGDADNTETVSSPQPEPDSSHRELVPASATLGTNQPPATMAKEHKSSSRETSSRSPQDRAKDALANLAKLVGNLVVLTFPTLCVLLLSGWGPEEISIIFDDFFPYIGLSFLVTLVLVVIDEVTQELSKRLNFPKLLQWMLEFVLSALGAGTCLFFFTHSALGAFFLGLIISVLTSLISQLVAKLF